MTPQDAARGWLRQAHNDLVHARWSLQAGHADWACLAAHHATEKALKGLALDRGHRPLATRSPALLAMDLMELGVIDEADVAALGDLDALESTARRLRDPRHNPHHPRGRTLVTFPESDPEAEALAKDAVALTEQVLSLVGRSSASPMDGSGQAPASPVLTDPVAHRKPPPGGPPPPVG